MKVLVFFMEGSLYILKIDQGKGLLLSLRNTSVQRKKVSKNIIRHILYDSYPRRYEVNLPIRLDYFITIKSKHFNDRNLISLVKSNIRGLISNHRISFFYDVDI